MKKMKYENKWKIYTRGGRISIYKEFKRFRKGTKVLSKIVKLKRPIGKHTHAIYYKPFIL